MLHNINVSMKQSYDILRVVYISGNQFLVMTFALKL
jgi:hypothetical protein